MTTHASPDQRWSQLYESGRDFTLITSEALSKVVSFTKRSLPKTCLDIGCGTGQLTRELYHRGYNCVGIDASASAINIARSLTLVPAERLQYVHFDIEEGNTNSLPRQKYSLITCKLVYAFIQDKPAFLRKVKQLLGAGGIFVVITPHIADIPVERRNIAVNDDELALLGSHFTQVALIKGKNRVEHSPISLGTRHFDSYCPKHFLSSCYRKQINISTMNLQL